MRYPARAFRAVAFLFRAYNDVDVYVEDRNSRNVYDVLVNRHLDGKAVVRRLIQVGDRESILKACRRDQAPSSRHRLYIIDGDFDHLLGEPAPRLRHLYRLHVYCLENLLFSEDAATELAFECLSNTDRASAANAVDFSHLAEAMLSLLVPLFCMYAVVTRMLPEVGTVSVNVMALCETKRRTQVLSPAKVEARVRELRMALRKQYTDAQIDAELDAVNRRVVRERRHKARFVSGKAYLLPLLYHRLKACAGYKGSIEELKVRLARHTALDLDPQLGLALRKASQSA